MRPKAAAKFLALQAQVRDVAAAHAGTAPDEVLLVPPRTVPKTSRGKIRRSTARELYENNRIEVSPRSVRGGRSCAWLSLPPGKKLVI
jgi:acyl-CoA synthetase (AMP-forming)/AMP-acid ligase II